METSNILNEILKSRKNLLIQLKNAGYNVGAYENMTMNEIYFMHLHDELNFQVKADENKTVLVKYYLKSTLRPKNIQDMTSELFSPSNEFTPNECIIVLLLDSEPNSSILDLVKQIYAEENILIVLYNINRLQFNILDHVMVPKHQVLSVVEEKQFREKFNVLKDSDIPTISRFDPVAIAIFIRPGEICKITRSSVNAIESDYYRLCVNL